MPSSTKLLKPKKSKKSDLENLTIQKRMFAEHLIADKAFSIKKAAESVGVKNPTVVGARWMKDEKVLRYIGSSILQRIEGKGGFKANAERVLHELMCIGYFNQKSVRDEDGNGIPLKDLPDEVAAAIESMEIQEISLPDGTQLRNYKYKFYNKLEALSLLGKHLGMWIERKEIDLKGTLQFANWDSLYEQDQNVVDPVEELIKNPKLLGYDPKSGFRITEPEPTTPIDVEQANYSVSELLDDE